MKIKNIKLACAATAGSCIGVILSRGGIDAGIVLTIAFTAFALILREE